MNFLANSTRPGYLILLSLFSCALLFDLASGAWMYPYLIAFMMLMTGLQFLNYRFWWATVPVVIGYLSVSAPVFPRLANHGNIEVFLCFAFLGYLLYRYVLKRKGIKPETVTAGFTCTLIVVYFMAGFHKLNSGFFSLAGTCSTFVNDDLNALLFGKDFTPPEFIIRVSQVSTILIEMVVPFGLLHQKTRKPAAWLLVIFHFYLNFCKFSNFSVLGGFMIAGSVLDLRKESYPLWLINGLRIYLFFAFIAAIVSYCLWRFELTEYAMIRIWNGCIFNIGWIVFFAILLEKNTLRKGSTKFPAIAFLPGVLIILWSMQPYAGLTNAGTLTMFSNLVTETSHSNHYLINTKKTKLWHFEEDSVTLLELPDNLVWKGTFMTENYILPLIEFKSQAHKLVLNNTGPIKCTILYKDKVIHIEDLHHSEFSRVEWWYHYLFYRKRPASGVNECLW